MRTTGDPKQVSTAEAEKPVAVRQSRFLTTAVPYAIAAKLGLLLLLAWNTRFVMDEFVQLGQAKYLGHGFFSTIWPVKAVGYTVFYKGSHLLGWNAKSILLIGRLQTALLGCAVVAMIYSCCRALQASKPQALVAVLVLLSFSNFMERIFRTRAEPLAVFFAVAALLVLVRGASPTAKRIVIAGIFGGLSFVTTQKSIYFNIALGVGLLADAGLQREIRLGLTRGIWLVLGWLLPVTFYCLIFGGIHPLPLAENLFFGPADLVSKVPSVYSGLRYYVWQTLSRNTLLYFLCFAAMAIELVHLRSSSSSRRIALVFSVTITLLVFSHNQPWPYVFVMALPFIALWIPALLGRVSGTPRYTFAVGVALVVAIAFSFARNVAYFRLGNTDQLAVVARAEQLVGPNERYFDGNGMLPNRWEPSTLWLDRPMVLETLRQGERSEAYRIFAHTPPKIVIWSYRMDAIEPVVGPLIQASYVHVAPNIWIVGRRLSPGVRQAFKVAAGGKYRLYDERGNPATGTIELDGRTISPPFDLVSGTHQITLLNSRHEVLLLPDGAYAGRLTAGEDYQDLFADVYE